MTRHAGQPLPRDLRALARRPRRLLAGGRRGRRLVRAAEPRLRSRGRHLRALVPGRRHATPATTRSTATSRPAAASRPRSSTTARSRARRRTHHLRRDAGRGRARSPAAPGRARRRQGRPRRHLHADGAGGGRRHAAPARGSARSIRSCSAASRRASSPPASTTRGRRSSSPPPAASSRAASSPTSRCSTRRSSSSTPQAGGLPRPAAAAARRGRSIAGRDLDWAEAVGGRRVARASRPPARRCAATDPLYILYTSGTTGRPKGVVRDTGGHLVALALVDAEPLRRRSRARSSGRPPTSAGWSATPTSSTRRCFHGATTRALRGQARRHARCRRLLAGRARSTASSTLFTAPTALAGHPQGGSGGRAACGRTTCRRSARCSSPASGPIPTRSRWAERVLGVPVDRPLVADRDRLADRRQPARPRARCR